MKHSLRVRCWFSAAFLIGSCISSGAQTTTPPAARAYAVISEVARQVSVVSFQEATGSRLTGNIRSRIDVPDGALDKVFLISAQKALNQTAPAAAIWLLAPADSDFLGFIQVSTGDRVKIPDDLMEALRERKSTHLLIFTRHRDEAALSFVDGSDGSGPLEGLGYYVDHFTSVRMNESNDRSVAIGYLASFAHFRATLVEVASSRVVSSLTTRANLVTPTASVKSGSSHPWDALSPTQKMTQLRDLVIKEVDRMVPALTAGKP